ncbi:J domain-containing protein [Kineosporia babensis]|uniref:J domain-containing protein n=1 Tax=Kineosporia babensis TaxID=499548 RepID=UPI0038B324D6
MLGVLETAGPDEVNKAYRRRMRELHPDRGGDRDEAQHVSVAHRWLTRHRGGYERFVFERRQDDPQWGRVLEPVAAEEFDFPAPGTSTGSFRSVGQERMAGRAAEWAERQHQQRGSWREGPPTSSWPRPGAEVRTEWSPSPSPSPEGDGGGSGVAGSAGDGAGPAWVVGPPTQEQMLLDVSRQEVARRREARLKADAQRRARRRAAAGSASSAGGAATGSVRTGEGSAGTGRAEPGKGPAETGPGFVAPAEVSPSGSWSFPGSASSAGPTGSAGTPTGFAGSARSGGADGPSDPVSPAGPAEPAAGISSAAATGGAATATQFPDSSGSSGSAGSGRARPGAATGGPSRVFHPPYAAEHKPRSRRRLRLPRMGLPRLPAVGLPSAPRIGLPSLPRVGLPRLGFRVLPKRRGRASVGLDAIVLAVLVVVLGLLVAARIPF